MRHRFPLLLLLLLPACNTLPTGPAPAAPNTLRGITFVDWSREGYLRPEAMNALEELAGSGADEIAILVTAYQQERSSSEIGYDSLRSPSMEGISKVAGIARRLGLRVTIKLHIESDDGVWRAMIDPADPERWFTSYRNLLLPLARLTEELGGTRFMIGTELAGTLRNERLWRETIAQVREVFSGTLLYAASWDEAPLVPFWDALDEIGVNFYFPVTVRKNPGRMEILAGWRAPLERIRLLHESTGRTVVLTELGYRSVDGAGMRPYEYGVDGTPDPPEQADLYWAALRTIADTPWLAGMYWWNWPANGAGGDADQDYSPARKPALKELQGAWRK